MNASTALGTSHDSRTQLSESRSDLQNRLDGWKEISLYLKRSVRCVQRWERNERLPVHRHKHLHGMTVYAFRHELDAWWHDQRHASTSAKNAASVDVPGQDTAPANPRPSDKSLRNPKSLSLANILLVFRQLASVRTTRVSTNNLQSARKSG